MTSSSCRTVVPGLALVAIVFAGLTGCSSFERDWNAMAMAETPDPGVEGYWSGTWQSDTNGHDGALRCIVAPDEDGTLQARYHATYAGALTFEYAMPMEVWREGDAYRFTAEANLGLLAGGWYEYDGRVVGDAFTATYSSAGDRGTFAMTRVEPEAIESVFGADEDVAP